MQPTTLCLSSYFKGSDFMIENSKLGNYTILITSESLQKEDWPWEYIDEVFYMPEEKPFVWNINQLVEGIAYLLKTKNIDTVVALDDYDVEKAAEIREIFRIKGMGQTTHRYFRDKLAMRQKAVDTGHLVPVFSSVFNDKKVNDFLKNHEPPYVLKPRSAASATGIILCKTKDEVFENLNKPVTKRHELLIECFIEGQVYHVDSLVYNNKVIFSHACKYLSPPMEVSHSGGLFRTITLSQASKEANKLIQSNDKLLIDFGMEYGASHTEFIVSDDGKVYFLETSSRVGGAYIHKLIEAATGINLWKEWAKIEDSVSKDKKYKLPKVNKAYAALLITLAKTEYPDLSSLEDSDDVVSIKKPYHVALLLKNKRKKELEKKLEEVSEIVLKDHFHSMPPSDIPLN